MQADTSGAPVHINQGLVKLVLWLWALGFGAIMINVFVIPVGIIFGIAMFKIARGNPELGSRKEAVFMIASSIAVGVAVLKSWPMTVLVLVFGPLVLIVLEGCYQELKKWYNNRKEVSA